jgi:hypothetical protein
MIGFGVSDILRSDEGSGQPAAQLPRLFFGYPSHPAGRRSTLTAAAVQIARMVPAATRTWEQLDGASGFIIDDVFREIDAADVSIFDLTDLNENVLFEFGYAIGSRRAVWILRDPAFPDSERGWKQLGTLATIRYASYTNPDDIRIAFVEERPDLGRQVIFDESIGPALQPQEDVSVFYVKSLYDTDASRALTRRIHDERSRGLRIVEADPVESSYESLAWYAQQIYGAAVVVIHFDDPRRTDARVHNGRLALVSGLARGMNKPILMLAEDEYLAPIDYQDLLYVYKTANQATGRVDVFLRRELEKAYATLQEHARRNSRLRLATELRSLRLGEHVAENEVDVLGEYFLRTAAYEEVLHNRTTVFVGRKGTGKSANAIEAAAELRFDKRQLVCLIQPYAYELAAVTSLLAKYQTQDQKGFVVESVWKFLLYSEIALAAYREIRDRPPGVGMDNAEAALVEYLDDAEFLTQDFAVRLERTIERLLALGEASGVEAGRVAISEQVHSVVVGELRRKLIGALANKVRIAVLIDNLDRVWERGERTRALGDFLFGLITAAERIESEVSHESAVREPLRLAVAIFLRSDIFADIANVAPEPDKLPVTRLNWDEPELRLQVLEERYLATREGSALPDELWDRYFCSTVRGVDVREYLTWRTLPRPRDILFLANRAIVTAINHRNPRVEERDILLAESDYSQFAIEALEVEAPVTDCPIIDILFEFLGGEALLREEAVHERLRSAGVAAEHVERMVDDLRALSFLGVEVKEGEFVYVDDTRELSRTSALARVRSGDQGVRYAINPAFRPYLDLADPDLPPGQLQLHVNSSP